MSIKKFFFTSGIVINNKKLTTLIILLLMLVTQAGTDIYLASIPAISIAFATDANTIQYSFSLFLASFALSQLFFGPLSDRFGRKPCVLCGLLIYGAMSLVCAFSHSTLELLFARVIQGAGAGACTVVARSMMQDSFSGKELEKINVYQSMVWSVVPITAPLIGSYVQHYLTWQYNFLILLFIGMGLFVLCCFYMPETHLSKEKHLHFLTILKDYKNILFNRQFLKPLIFCACIVSIVAVFNISAPLIIQNFFKLSPIAYGWSTFVVAISFAAGSFFSKLLINKLSTSHHLLLGLSIIVTGCLLLLASTLFLFSNVFTFLLSIIILQFGCAVAFPIGASITMSSYILKSGKASAVFGFILFASSSSTSSIMAQMSENSLYPFSLILVCLIFIMLISYIFTRSSINESH